MPNENYSLFIVIMLIALLQLIDADNKFDAKELLNLHNRYRDLHGSGKLELDSKLSALAMDAALNEANNIPYKIENYGINTYWIKHNELSSTDEVTADEVTAETVFNYWYSEGKDYPYKREPMNKDNIKHFTQVVWKNTTHIGIAMAHVKPKTAIVALYFPKGNLPRYYKINVLKPRD